MIDEEHGGTTRDNVVSIGERDVGPGVRLDPDKVLLAAVQELESVVVIGVDKSGELYVASSTQPIEAFALIEHGKRFMIAEDMKSRGWDE